MNDIRLEILPLFTPLLRLLILNEDYNPSVEQAYM